MILYDIIILISIVFCELKVNFTVFSFLKEIFFPSKVKCIICENELTEKYSICSDCLEKFKIVKGQRCKVCLDKINTQGFCADCLKKRPFYTMLYSPYVYESPLKELILKYKTGNNEYLKEYFACIALDSIPEEVLDKCNLITNVPCSKEKLKLRGYDQGKVLAKEISKKTSIPYKETLVRLSGEKTARLNKAKRIDSVKERYLFCDNVYGQTVLLIDDVCTTGATLRYCSEQLKTAGAKEVFCFTIARTDKNWLSN